MVTETQVINVPIENLNLTTEEYPELKWLTKSFLEDHLRNHFSNKTISVQSFQAKPATAKGENFCSAIYRVKVQYLDENENLQNLNIILKTALTSGTAFEMLTLLDAYSKEIEFYGKIAPKIESLLCEKNEQLNGNESSSLRKVDEPEQVLPKVYGVCDVNNAILLEDMRPLGYAVGPVQQGFNIEEAEIILQRVALLHAAAAVLQEREPDIFKNYPDGMLTQKKLVLTTFYQDQFDTAVSVISTWPEYAHYAEKMKKMSNKLIEKIREDYVPDPNGFNTLAHMDLWTNNLLLKCTDVCENGVKKLENVIAIDFSYSYWTTPIMDLHYFFNTSVEDSNRPQVYDGLIAFYHGHLESYLRKLDYKKHIPTLEELRKKYFEKIFYGVLSSFLIHPVLVNQQTENADYDTLTQGGDKALELKRLIFATPKTQANLKNLLPYFDQHGAFD